MIARRFCAVLLGAVVASSDREDSPRDDEQVSGCASIFAELAQAAAQAEDALGSRPREAPKDHPSPGAAEGASDDESDDERARVALLRGFVQQWYAENEARLPECVAAYAAPAPEDTNKQYARNVLAASPEARSIVFLHRMKADGTTALHDHGRARHVFVLPLTDSLVEDEFESEEGDDSGLRRLRTVETHALIRGTVSVGTGAMLHRVRSVAQDGAVQSFIELYFPPPAGMNIYVPVYPAPSSDSRAPHAYFPVSPRDATRPHYATLLDSTPEGARGSCDALRVAAELDAAQGRPFFPLGLFTSTGSVVVDRSSLEAYLTAERCEFWTAVGAESGVLMSARERAEL